MLHQTMIRYKIINS